MKPWNDEVKEGVSTWMTGRPSFGATSDPVTISIDYSNTDATDPLSYLAPEPTDETTVPVITDPLQVGRVRHKPDPRKKKRRRKQAQASKRRNRR
jgi:hypothetical protein